MARPSAAPGASRIRAGSTLWGTSSMRVPSLSRNTARRYAMMVGQDLARGDDRAPPRLGTVVGFPGGHWGDRGRPQGSFVELLGRPRHVFPREGLIDASDGPAAQLAPMLGVAEDAGQPHGQGRGILGRDEISGLPIH